MDIAEELLTGADGLCVPRPYTKWPWEDEMTDWMGKATFDRREEVMKQIRDCYIPGPLPPLYPTEIEWRLAVKKGTSERLSSKAELAVHLLTSVIAHERTAAKNGDDTSFIASSIRKQRGEHACLGMYNTLQTLFSQLDDAPSLEDLRELYNESNLSSSHLKYVPKLKLQRYIMLKGMSAGAKPVSKLEHAMKAYRESVGNSDTMAATASEAMLALGHDLPPHAEEENVEKALLAPKKSEESLTTRIENSTLDMSAQSKTLDRSTVKQAKEMAKNPEQLAPKEKIKQYKLVESHMKEICNDDELLVDLWLRVDLNGNKELGYNECCTFMASCYPILASSGALHKSFHDAAAISKDDPEGNDAQTGRPSGVIVPRGFRKFLLLSLYYSQCQVAFNLMDWNLDAGVDAEEFEHGAKVMRKFLKIDDIEFKDICPEDKEEFSFKDLCNWMSSRMDAKLKEFEFDALMMARDKAEQVLPRTMDYNEFADLVIHAHYVNRNTGE